MINVMMVTMTLITRVTMIQMKLICVVGFATMCL